MNTKMTGIQAIAILNRRAYKLGFLESDGKSMKPIPTREGKTYLQYTEETGYADGWNDKSWFNEFGTGGDVIKALEKVKGAKP